VSDKERRDDLEDEDRIDRILRLIDEGLVSNEGQSNGDRGMYVTAS
jgi:hypothetical protein